MSVEEIDYICDHLWTRHLEEITALGKGLDEIRQKAKDSELSTVLRYEGEPVAFIALDVKDDVAYTFFLSTDRFKDHWRKITMDLIMFLKNYRFPVHKLEIWGVLVDRKVARWYQTLGFHLDRTVPFCGTKAQVFVMEV